MYTHTPRQPLPPQRGGKWSKRDCNGDLCTSCRKPGPFNILVASLQEADAYLLMKPLCSYEVFHFSQSPYDFLKSLLVKTEQAETLYFKTEKRISSDSHLPLLGILPLSDWRRQYYSI